MWSSRGLASSVVVLLLGAGAVLAQAPADTKPATDSKSAAAPSTPAAGDKTDKKAISKACSDQATAKGLHGKERKTFRAECKKSGGQPA
jgi:subtilisin family serine protease